MDLGLLRRLIEEEDPLQVLYEALAGTIWTAERLARARQNGDLEAYLGEGEHAASALEHEVYDVYRDLYALLESDDPRRDRVQQVHREAQYTLLLIDGLSLRELPLVQAALAARGLEARVDFALAPLPSETSAFCHYHYGANGPSDMANHSSRYPFAFRHVTRERWQPDFSPAERRRFIWYAFPDDYFGLKETGYARHVAGPIEAIVGAVIEDPSWVQPLIITGDHGYLWQGARCAWALERDEGTVLAEHFKAGRSALWTSDALARTGKAWVQGSTAAARGRFAWGGMVHGPSSLFKHGGVSLMECLVPIISMENIQQ